MVFANHVLVHRSRTAAIAARRPALHIHRSPRLLSRDSPGKSSPLRSPRRADPTLHDFYEVSLDVARAVQDRWVVGGAVQPHTMRSVFHQKTVELLIRLVDLLPPRQQGPGIVLSIDVHRIADPRLVDMVKLARFLGK